MAEFDPTAPYNDLPDLPPPIEEIETTDILKRCINARVALAELKQAAELIPNSTVLVNALPLLCISNPSASFCWAMLEMSRLLVLASLTT